MALLLALFALAAGVGLPVQAGVNTALARHLGRPEWAAVTNFAVGLVGLCLWTLVSSARLPSPSQLAAVPGWAWVGGLLGAFYVTAVILLTPRLGLATTLGLLVAGQLAAALVFDRLGAFGVDARPITPARALGVALLIAAVALIRR
jgi:transporter family-2 protein